MGGDGGVIASNRKYMRGAGTADHTGDAQRQAQSSRDESSTDRLTTCHISHVPLNPDAGPIVACPYGRLYLKEAAVEALLHSRSRLGSHIRGLGDLHPVHYQWSSLSLPVCPVTGKELHGTALLLPIETKEGGPNVVSEQAVKEMGMESLQTEYGPFEEDRIIRLAPPVSMMEEIREQVQKQQETEKTKKKGKKRKKIETSSTFGSKHSKSMWVTSDGIADVARKSVASAVASNDVLSSLFASTNAKTLSDKEKKDNLFART